jgi:hypothetical protein
MHQLINQIINERINVTILRSFSYGGKSGRSHCRIEAMSEQGRVGEISSLVRSDIQTLIRGPVIFTSSYRAQTDNGKHKKTNKTDEAVVVPSMCIYCLYL